MTAIELHALGALEAPAFAGALQGIFEHAPWVAERTADRRPFATVAALHDALMATVDAATAEEVVAFLNGHPELAADRLPPGLTTESEAEQSGLSMERSSGAAELPALNQAYRERFGFPFIVCVARHTPENVLRTLRRRLLAEPAAERQAALDEIRHITRLRLVSRVSGPGLPVTAGHLSTHVLDTSSGKPAAGIAVSLLQEGRAVTAATTDADGRTGELLPVGPLRQGQYTLVFGSGEYFSTRRQETLYVSIPIQFTIAHAEARYHIPLLLSPFGYTTYRGS